MRAMIVAVPCVLSIATAGCCITLPASFGDQLAFSLGSMPEIVSQRAWERVCPTHPELWVITPTAEGLGIYPQLTYCGTCRDVDAVAPDVGAALIQAAIESGSIDGTLESLVHFFRHRPGAAVLLNTARAEAVSSMAIPIESDATDLFGQMAAARRESAAMWEDIGAFYRAMRADGWDWFMEPESEAFQPILVRRVVEAEPIGGTDHSSEAATDGR